MAYIDAGKMIAEIKIIQQSLEHRDVRLNAVKKIRTESMIELCKCILGVIDSLKQEQPEADLEKEYKTWWNSISGKINVKHMIERYTHKIARHFYELGRKARREE